jgi:phosphoglycolate phosphatase
VLAAARIDADAGAALPRFLELYDERLLDHTELYPGTAAALQEMARHTPLALLTNKPQHPTDRLLDGLGIAGYFQEVLGGDTALGRKPDPAGLRHLMAAAGARPDNTTLVGDSAIDLRTARAAGVRICLVRYGFGFPLAEGELRGDELIADRAADLPAVIAAAE